MGIAFTKSAVALNKVSAHLKEAWSPVGVLIIDECSFLGCAAMYEISQRLQAIKGVRGTEFGGVHIIFAGDFYQLPPVGCGPVYEVPRRGSGQKHILGHEIWKTKLTAVVELTQNHRQHADPLYAQLLERMRTGVPTAEDLRLLNTRVVSPGNIPPQGTPIAAATNSVRQSLSHYYFMEYLKANPVTFDDNDVCTTDWKVLILCRLFCVPLSLC